MPTQITSFFTVTAYLLTLPMIMLTVFALGILMIDLIVPPQWKRLNAITALAGIGFSAAALFFKIQHAHYGDGTPVVGSFGYILGGLGQMRMDTFAVYFSYLFLLGAAIAILMSVRYL